MAIGFGKKPRGLFGNPGMPMAGQTPGFGDGVREQMQGAPMGLAAPEQAPEQPARQGRSTAQRVAGYFADAAAGFAGQQGPYAAQLQQERQREQQLADMQRQRAEKFADWQKQYDYERANPAASAANLQYFDDNAGNRYAYDPATGTKSLIFTDPNDKIYMQDGQMIRVPNAVRQQQAGAVTGPAVGTERNGFRFKGGNPNDQNSWEPVAQGGPASQAPGGFRR